ncbi:EAL domain-containing protein [Pelomonas sp. CA6]|uniref:bifunctional diguanylate cyclase/phosphodiesterase n=1 Tax=Pelomonas sp. CA6 TaxID=2907999 RepID=UPI001F4C4C5E|nr:EAL domain-containing protein [Pelomonas sp. CA6]MCH7343534.1 EAL domain-containing protein [Pelomonas sp. CA6]
MSVSALLPYRRTARPWVVLVLLLTVGWAGALWWLAAERDALRRYEGDKLQVLVQTLDGIVSQQMIAIQAALKTLQLQQRQRPDEASARNNAALLDTLVKAMPGVRVMMVVDAEGRVRASSVPKLIGMDVRHRAYYAVPAAQLQSHPETLYVSPPFRSVLGADTVTLSRTLFDEHNRFAGVVTASLDSDYFRLVLETAQTSPHTWSALTHQDGQIFVMMPRDPAWEGRNLLDTPGSVLGRFLASGEDARLETSHALISGDQRMVSARKVRPAGLRMHRTLIVAVGRSIDHVETPWRRQLYAVLLVGLPISLAAGLALLLWQRRQRLVDTLHRRQRRMERDSAERMALALEGAALGQWDWSVSTGAVHFDARWCGMLGYRSDELEPHVSTWEKLLHPDDRPGAMAHLNEYLEGRGEQFTVQFRMRHHDGHWVWIHSNGRVMAHDADGRPARMVGTHLDISTSKNNELLLLTQAQHTQAILDNMVDGVITIDAQGRVDSINPSACRMFGYEWQEVVGRNVNMLMPHPDRAHHDDYIRNYLQHGVARVIGLGRDVTGLRKDGTVFPMSLAVSRIEREGRPMFIGLTRDITERKRAEAEIEKLAFYDALTGLPNRRLLLDRLRQALAASRRGQRHGALLFLDMDNFKSLNDTLGHGMGDQLLKEVAQRLQASLRADDTVARWGGDEFVVLLQDLGTTRDMAVQHAEAAGEKLLRVLGQPYQLDGRAQHSTPSIGIALWGDGEPGAEELLKHADHAMYQAKAGGRNQLCFFDPVTQAAMAERTALETDLREAIASGQFELHYQAQVGRDGRLVGAETLLRWKHPQRGWVSPARFIPLAEQTGLIVPIGEWVLQRSCEQLAQWAEEPCMAPLSLAVNVSANQFRQKGFLSFMQQLLARSGAPTDKLKIELTESAVIEDVEAVIRLMGQLRALGLRFSLDDFGTGYSSLAYLKRLPLAQLKIDQSFVRDLLTEPNARAIARAVIQLGDSLGLDVIAEGVESEAQRELLAGQGCHAFQGYWFSRPLPLADFEALARQWPGPAHGPAPQA